MNTCFFEFIFIEVLSFCKMHNSHSPEDHSLVRRFFERRNHEHVLVCLHKITTICAPIQMTKYHSINVFEQSSILVCELLGERLILMKFLGTKSNKSASLPLKS